MSLCDVSEGEERIRRQLEEISLITLRGVNDKAGNKSNQLHLGRDVSWQRGTKPNSLKSGTKLAHTIAAASIKELLLSKDALSIGGDGPTSENIFRVGNAFEQQPSQETHPYGDENEDFDVASVVSMLSQSSAATKAQQLISGFGGDDMDDKVEEGLATDNSAKEISVAAMTALGGAYEADEGGGDDNDNDVSDSKEATMQQSKRRYEYYFLKLVQNRSNRVRARKAVSAWKQVSDKENKAKTLGFRLWLCYRRHLMELGVDAKLYTYI